MTTMGVGVPGASVHDRDRGDGTPGERAVGPVAVGAEVMRYPARTLSARERCHGGQAGLQPGPRHPLAALAASPATPGFRPFWAARLAAAFLSAGVIFCSGFGFGLSADEGLIDSPGDGDQRHDQGQEPLACHVSFPLIHSARSAARFSRVRLVFPDRPRLGDAAPARRLDPWARGWSAKRRRLARCVVVRPWIVQASRVPAALRGPRSGSIPCWGRFVGGEGLCPIALSGRVGRTPD